MWHGCCLPTPEETVAKTEMSRVRWWMVALKNFVGFFQAVLLEVEESWKHTNMSIIWRKFKRLLKKVQSIFCIGLNSFSKWNKV